MKLEHVEVAEPEKIVEYRIDGSVYCENWFLNGNYHREDGPALIYYDIDGSIDIEFWFLNGQKMLSEEVEDLKLRLEVDKLAEQMLVGEL